MSWRKHVLTFVFLPHGLAYAGFYSLQYYPAMFLYGDHSLESQNLLQRVLWRVLLQGH